MSTIPIPTLTGEPSEFDREDVQSLWLLLQRERVRPSDDDFEEATRHWNSMIDKTPAMVVQPTDVDDVVAAVERCPRARPPALRHGVVKP